MDIKIKLHFLLVSLSAILLLTCSPGNETSKGDENVSQQSDPLPSWNEGKVKSEIIDFVVDVSNPESPNFVQVKDRIATFDNDGNLWCEKPMYFQLIFAMQRIQELAPQHPEWNNEQPFKAVIENDLPTVLEHGIKGVLKLVMASHAGITTKEFEASVRQWLTNERHPRFGQPYNKVIYQPMLELLAYLQANDFKTFIVSGGGIDFMRVWVEDAYGIPKDQIVGSSIKKEFDYNEDDPVIRNLAEVHFVDDREGKPVGIHQHIGRRPIFASGNSDGDLQMLQYTTAGEGRRFALYLHHTDSVREYAYDRNSHVGRLDKGLDEAREKNWSVIDMKRDWKVVFPFEVTK